ncbi:MAG: S8 family serine peptidase [Planctomycetota bacterium]
MITALLLVAVAQLARQAPLDRDATARTLEWAARSDCRPRVWVFFTDKAVAEVDRAERLRAAAAALEPHARARRAKVLPELVDAADLEVAPAYVDAVRARGACIVRVSRWLNAVSVRADGAALVAVAELPFVRRLQPVAAVHGAPRWPAAGGAPAAGAPANAQDRFAYGASRPQLDEIGVLALHRRGLSGAGVIVALFDTGFDWTHPVFQHIVASGRLLAQHDFINNDGETRNEPGDDPDQHIHGTIVWSVLAGFAPGQLIGPAYGASFLLAKTEDVTSETRIEEDNWIAAAEWADQRGADVISSSLIYTDWYTYPDMDGDTAPITIAADLAAQRGIVPCSAAGNSATQDFYYIGAPADGDLSSPSVPRVRTAAAPTSPAMAPRTTAASSPT